MAQVRPYCMSLGRAWAAALLAALTLVAVPVDAATAAGTTSLRVVPTPVPAGSTVTLFGHGFCGATDCPPVQIDADGQRLATAAPRADGSFSVRAPVHLAPNQYQVRASQTTPSGTLSATTGMTVLPPETGGGAPTPTATGDRSPPGGASTAPPAVTVGPSPPTATGADSATPATSAGPTTSAPDVTPTPTPLARGVAGPSRPARAPDLALGLLAGAVAACIPLSLLLRLAVRRGRI